MTTPTKKYKVIPPVGSIVVAKEFLTEAELRTFALQINNVEENREVWAEKIEKDPVEQVVEWFRGAGFTVTEHEK